ncbi:MAG TPA: nitrilase-related carbon-nitrogen hydrolase [Acidobacteriaceae bacterium]|nr:nitrilase-related carbon-nitrogen hydrolase [Acidobacteriaceae bacterium]
MESGNSLRNWVAALLATAATAVLVFFGNGMEPRRPLMWLAPLPVLWYALRSAAWRGAVVAFVAWMTGGLNLWSYMRGLGAHGLAWVLDFGTGALIFAAAALLMRARARRGAVWSAWLALPAAWVTFEYVRNLLWPHGSAACLAYSQLNFVPFLQTASLAGPWGMSFVLLLFPAGLALGIHRWGTERRQAVRLLGATMGVVGALLLFGAVRMSLRQPGPELRVGLVASDTNGGVARPGAPTEQRFALYAQQAEGLIARGAQVVVMPENLGVVIDPDVARADAIFQNVADRTGATLVVGMSHAASLALQHNEARIYTPGAPVRAYDKEHLLPPFENMYTPGTARVVLSGTAKAAGAAGGERWGVAICKDLDFTNPARAYGRAGVGVLFAPAWDFQVDAFWHGHIAVMRAVEDGFSLVRAARGGFLTVADDRGRIVAETRSSTAPFATLLATVPTGHDGTLFQLWGDWFGWAAIALLAVVLARLVAGRPRAA